MKHPSQYGDWLPEDEDDLEFGSYDYSYDYYTNIHHEDDVDEDYVDFQLDLFDH